jgi:simple sugar transport system substrate-binding protein
MVPRLAAIAAAFIALAALIGSTSAQEPLRFVLVTHGHPSDPFWAAVREGAEAAALEAGVALDHRAPETFDLEAMAALVQQAVREKPAGMIVSIPNGDALAGPIKSAGAAGIPVISINSGFDVSASLGAMLHVGQSEYDAGRVAGESMRALGGSRALCLNHEVGNVALDLRCKGFIDGFGGSVQVLAVEADPDMVGDTLAELLASDSELDVVMALSASVSGEPAIAVAKSLGPARRVRVGSFDATDPVLAAVAGGDASFAVDQQPFLQGYLPVQYLALYHRRGLAPVSSVSTGPRLVNAEQAAQRLGRDLRGGSEPETHRPDSAPTESVGQ